MSEKFSLKWNDFHSNVSKSFEILRTEDYLQDVTLVGDDDCQVKAHKLVLSACSSYFKKIFTKNMNSNILLCLEGTDQTDLKNILDYIYFGEVQIFQEELDRFLNIAQRLKLEGMMGDSNETKQDGNEEKIEHSLIDEDRGSEWQKPQQKKRTTMTREIETCEDKVILPMSSHDMAEVNEKINQSFEKVASEVYKCLLCEKVSKKSIDIKRHVETHLEGLSYPCQQCGKTFRSKNSLSNHVSLKHK